VSHAGSYEDFFAAILRDNPDNLRALLQRGFDPNTVDPKGETGFVLALRANASKAAQALVEHPGFDVNALNATGESPLMLAAIRGDVALSRRLVERGARINLPGWSPLHYAASGPATEIVALLLDRGAEVDAGSPNATTALMMAARYGSEDSVALLLSRGADATRRNQLELTAADFAAEAGRKALAERLRTLARPAR
jgi:hypothetical protein